MASITRRSLSRLPHEAPSSASGLSRNHAATGTWFIVLVGMLSLAVLAIAVSLVVPAPEPAGAKYFAGQFR